MGPTGRSRGGNGRPGRVGSGTSRKAAGSGRRGGRVGDDGVRVGVGESLGRARGRGAGVSPGLGTANGADGLVRSCDNGPKEFRVAIAGLLLSPAAEVTAPGDQSQGHEHS